MHYRIKKQHGSAIVVALFVMSLVAIAATTMIYRLNTDIRRTDLLLHADEAYLYAQGSVTWAIDQLNNDWVLHQPEQLVDSAPLPSNTHKINGFTISSKLEDMQGYFNINNLTSPDSQVDFQRLLHTVEPTLDSKATQQITLAITDWIAPSAGAYAYDEEYAKLDPPYRAPHRPMVSISELRLVKNMTAALYAKLSPYVTALPVTTTININHADIPVYMSLSPTLSLESAKALFLYRQQSPFLDVPRFLSFDIIKNNPISPSKITTTSNYFLLKTEVKVGQQQTILYTLLQRTTKNTLSTVTVLWQTKGTL